MINIIFVKNNGLNNFATCWCDIDKNHCRIACIPRSF